ncbi:hypothetical protein BHM03_00050227, partial [Ensete ventricosum]
SLDYLTDRSSPKAARITRGVAFAIISFPFVWVRIAHERTERGRAWRGPCEMACRTTSVLSGTGRGYAGKKETVGRRGGTHGSNRILGGDLTVAKARGTRRRVEERGGEWACRARVSAALPLVCRGVRACVRGERDLTVGMTRVGA